MNSISWNWEYHPRNQRNLPTTAAELIWPWITGEQAHFPGEPPHGPHGVGWTTPGLGKKNPSSGHGVSRWLLQGVPYQLGVSTYPQDQPEATRWSGFCLERRGFRGHHYFFAPGTPGRMVEFVILFVTSDHWRVQFTQLKISFFFGILIVAKCDALQLPKVIREWCMQQQKIYVQSEPIMYIYHIYIYIHTYIYIVTLTISTER